MEALCFWQVFLEKNLGVLNAWIAVMLAIGAVMILLAFYHMRMLPKGRAVTGEVKSLKGRFRNALGCSVNLLQKETHFLVYRIYYSVSFC